MWRLLTEAFYTIEPIAMEIQRYPNLDKMSAERLEEFLEESPLTSLQKAELKAAPAKVKYYRSVKTSYDVNKATDLYNEFHKTFSKNAIFIIEPIKAKF